MTWSELVADGVFVSNRISGHVLIRSNLCETKRGTVRVPVPMGPSRAASRPRPRRISCRFESWSSEAPENSQSISPRAMEKTPAGKFVSRRSPDSVGGKPRTGECGPWSGILSAHITVGSVRRGELPCRLGRVRHRSGGPCVLPSRSVAPLLVSPYASNVSSTLTLLGFPSWVAKNIGKQARAASQIRHVRPRRTHPHTAPLPASLLDYLRVA